MNNKEIKEIIYKHNQKHLGDHFISILFYVLTGFIAFAQVENHFNSRLDMYDVVSPLYKLLFSTVDALFIFLCYIAVDNLFTISVEKKHKKMIFKQTFFIQQQYIRILSVILYFGMKNNTIKELIPQDYMTMFHAIGIVLILSGVFYAFEFCFLLTMAILADMSDSLKEMFQRKPVLSTQSPLKSDIAQPIILYSVSFHKDVLLLQEKWTRLEEHMHLLSDKKVSYLMEQMNNLQQVLSVYDQVSEEAKVNYKEELMSVLEFMTKEAETSLNECTNSLKEPV